MFGSSILEIAIGIIFVYLLLSLICSAINEMIESLLKNRATELERGIRELFNQEGGGEMIEKFYNHPLISGLFRGPYERGTNKPVSFLDFLTPTNLPAYIPARSFSTAVIDLVLNPPTDKKIARDDSDEGKELSQTHVNTAISPATMSNLRPNLRALGDTQFARAIRTLAEQSGDDVNKLRENVEAWFNNSMDRVSGMYKRRTQWIIFLLGLIMTVLLNVNTITIVKSLSTDAAMRSVIVAEAETIAKQPNPPTPDLEAHRKQLKGLGLPIGWTNDFYFVSPFEEKFNFYNHALIHLLGWLLTAGAISMGAPFWFDLLNKFMVIRSTVKPHEKSPEEDSEDRQRRKFAQPVSPNLVPSDTSSANNSPPELRGYPPGSVPASSATALAVQEPVFTSAEEPEDEESDLDGCGIPVSEETLDEELPPSEGGVG